MAASLDYRLYLLNQDGRIVGAEVLRCADDTEAVAAARCRADAGPHATELWFRSRRIGYYPHGPRPTSGGAAAGSAT